VAAAGVEEAVNTKIAKINAITDLRDITRAVMIVERADRRVEPIMISIMHVRTAIPKCGADLFGRSAGFPVAVPMNELLMIDSREAPWSAAA